MLKTKLLATGIFLDNEYFKKYLTLVTCPLNSDLPDVIFEQHHILPVSYFKHAQLEVDNSLQNLVCLDIKNHVLAHYYLTLCSAVDWFYYGNATCVSLLTNRAFADISESWIEDNLTELNNIKQHRLYLNSSLQKGLQAAEKNPNCKYSKEICDQIKCLLLEGQVDDEIIKILNVPAYLISRIRTGNHWSCKEDNFTFLKADTLKLQETKKLIAWKATNPVCINCGKPLTIYLKSTLGDGCFCSKHCSLSKSAKDKYEREPELKLKIVANRDYSGENNPNYGKVASVETRLKISDGVKRSTSAQNTTRFAGKTHSAESKQKTSETLKKTWARKKNTKEN